MISEVNGCDCNIIHEDVINKLQDKLPPKKEVSLLADLFKIFGDSTRVKIMWVLHEHEVCVCDIAVLLNMTKSAISHQLSILKSNNLVSSRREGKVVFYALADSHVKTILEMGKEHINE